jgi:hypothetical protein
MASINMYVGSEARFQHWHLVRANDAKTACGLAADRFDRQVSVKDWEGSLVGVLPGALCENCYRTIHSGEVK